MAALDFPASPSVGQLYPASPVTGIPTYRWDGEKWTTQGGAIGSTGASNANPAMDGTAAPGVSTQWSRGDHVHPTDTSRAAASALASYAPLASPVFTGNPTGPTPALSDNDTSLATTAFVKNGVAIPAGTDFNTITDPGTYYSNSNDCTNTPNGTGGNWYLFVMRYPDPTNFSAQLACNVNGGLWYVRNKLSGSWSTSWRQIFDTVWVASALEYSSNTNPAKLVSVDTVWAATSYQTPSDSTGTITPNFQYFNHAITLTGTGRTLANPSNIKAGQCGMITILQDGTGNRTITTWGTNYKFPGGIKPVLSTPAGAVDAFSYYVLNTGFIECNFAGGYA